MTRRRQVARRRQLLSPDHVLVVHAGQVDGGALAAMQGIHRHVVIL